MKTTVTPEAMLEYLQEELTHALNEFDRYHDDHAMKKLEKVIAQKELVEAVICAPVNLHMDGRVTVGFKEGE